MMAQYVCDLSCRAGRCICGASGVLNDGDSIVSSLMFMDGARTTIAERKPLAMMTDAEIRMMRDSVRGMPLSKAKELPIYDEFKSLSSDGMPANEMRALYDGAVAEPREMTRDEAKMEAHRDHMIEGMLSASHPNVARHEESPRFARDGRPFGDLSSADRAYEQMTNDMSNAWRG